MATAAVTTGLVERRTTKKWMPTQQGANGAVSGVESLNKKNLEKHGEWGSFRFAPHMWPFLPAIAAFKMVKWGSDVRCQMFEQKTISDEPAPFSRSITRRVDAHPKDANPDNYANNDMTGRKGMKTDRMSAKHMQSNCAADRELWQRCVKDRFNRGVDCGPLLDQFRQCQDGTA
jgi:hypothetical protein